MGAVEIFPDDRPGPAAPETSPGTGRVSLLRRIGERIGASLLVIWLSITMTFIALQVVPGDPLKLIMGPGAILTPQAIAILRQAFGLDRPILYRYVGYFVGLLRGDLGLSYRSQQPVSSLIAGQVGPSLALTAAALLLAWFLAVASIVFTARRNRVVESVGRSLEVTLGSLPDFWLGLILITIFAFTLHWFASSGGGFLTSLVLPAAALAIPLAGFLAQVMRQSFEDALDQPFSLSARARGVSDWRLRLRHGLPHAALPALALSSWAFGWLISGSVAIEIIFARRGLGSLIFTAVSQRDYPVIMGSVVVIAVLYVFINLLTDVLSILVDPRAARPRDGAA
jgi:peptide/nickel transport system permease protein